jgi:hypothetical protein
MNEQEFRKAYEGTFDQGPRIKNIVLIVAAGSWEAKLAASFNHLARDQWKFVGKEQDMAGFKDAQVCFYGAWYRLHRAREIYEYAKAAGFEVVELKEHP